MKEDLGCADAIKRLDDYVDRQLNADDVAAIEQHLEACPPCADEFDFESNVVKEIRRKVAEVDVPRDLKARVLRRLSGDCD